MGTLSSCVTPVPPNQTWKYNSSGFQELTTSSGLCVTARSPNSKIKQTTMAFGRPLSKSSFAMVFLNNYNVTQNVTCDSKCMTNMIGMKPRAVLGAKTALRVSATYAVQDVWSGSLLKVAPVICIAAECDPVIIQVPAYGGTSYVRL